MNEDNGTFAEYLESMFGGARSAYPVIWGTQAGKTNAAMALVVNRQYGKRVEEMDFVSTVQEMDRLNDRLEVLRDHKAALESAGIDEYADGTVIRFTKPMLIRGIVRTLTYVAIKKADAWFVTGASGPNEVNWETLVLWAGPDNIADREIVKEWESR